MTKRTFYLLTFTVCVLGGWVSGVGAIAFVSKTPFFEIASRLGPLFLFAVMIAALFILLAVEYAMGWARKHAVHK